MEKMYAPDGTCSERISVGERWFLQRKAWKIAVMLGYNAWSDILTSAGLSFMNFEAGINRYNDAIKWLCENDIKHSERQSEGGWKIIINISFSSKNIQKIDALYLNWYNQRMQTKQAVESGTRK